MRRNHPIARLQQAKDEVDGRHPGRCHHRTDTGLELGQRVGKQIARGIGGSGILVGLCLLELPEGEIAGEIKCWRDGAMSGVAGDPVCGRDRSEILVGRH